MPRSRPWTLVAILALGGVLTIVSSLQDAPVLERPPDGGDPSLHTTERAYLDFMVPRLDRLIQEGSAVSTLVDGRSRDVLALSRHGFRISALAGEVIDWDSTNPVPSRFLSTHASLLASAHELEALIGEARQALLTFSFNDMSTLVTRFDDATATMRNVREMLPVRDDQAP